MGLFSIVQPRELSRCLNDIKITKRDVTKMLDCYLLQHTQTGGYLNSDGSIFTQSQINSPEPNDSLWDIQPLKRREDQTLLVKIRNVGTQLFLKVSDIFRDVDLQDLEIWGIDTWVIEKIESHFFEPFGFTYFSIYALANRKLSQVEVKLHLHANSFREAPPSPHSEKSSPSIVHDTPEPSSSISRGLFNGNEILRHWHIRQVAERTYKIHHVALGVCLSSEFHFQRRISTGLDYLSLVWRYWPNELKSYYPDRDPTVEAFWAMNQIKKNYILHPIEGTDEYHLLEGDQDDTWRLVPLPKEQGRDLDLASFPDPLQLSQTSNPSSSSSSSKSTEKKSIKALARHCFYLQESLSFSRLRIQTQEEELDALRKKVAQPESLLTSPFAEGASSSSSSETEPKRQRKT